MAPLELSDRRVLVTGGGGFVGAPTVRRLVDAGAHVRVLDVAESLRLDDVACELQIGDIAEPAVCARACDGQELVLHLAVLPLNQANEDTSLAFESNVRGSYNVFRAAGEQGVRRVVYSSASSAYGPTGAVPIREDHPLRPTIFYAASKAAAEMLLRGLAGTYGFSHAILRYMNLYGPGQRAGVVPAVARNLLAGRQPKLSGDGTQAFDFVHIEDCALANVKVLASGIDGEDFNVGSGRASSLNELVATMADLLDTDVRPEYQGDAAPAPPRVGTVDKLRELAGCEARVSLRDGLASVLDELRAAEPVS